LDGECARQSFLFVFAESAFRKPHSEHSLSKDNSSLLVGKLSLQLLNVVVFQEDL
jgi:hypothetical protein